MQTIQGHDQLSVARNADDSSPAKTDFGGVLTDMLTPSVGSLWCYVFEPAKAPRLVVDPNISRDLLGAGAWIWLHFPLSDQRARHSIQVFEHLPADAREMILSVEQRVQIQFQGEWIFGVLPDTQRDLEGAPSGPGRLQFAVGPGLMVSARRHALRVVDDLRKDCEAGKSVASPVELIGHFIERYVDLAESRAHEISVALDSIEDHILDSDADLGGTRLGPLRREISRSHREFLALRSALSRALSPRDHQSASDLSERLPRLLHEVEDLDRESISLQERARLLNEELGTRMTGATNRSMRALTVLSTMLIPPTLIVGAFGMNVGGVPFGTSHGGFIAASALCLMVVVGAWWLLRRMRILD